MRTTELYQIKDIVSESVVGPIISTYHKAAAIRHFTDLLQNKNSLIAQHPDDFVLLYLGNQDEITGEIDPLNNGPQTTITGQQWREVQEANAQRSQA